MNNYYTIYNDMKFKCKCGSYIRIVNKENHLKSKKHKRYLEKLELFNQDKYIINFK